MSASKPVSKPLPRIPSAAEPTPTLSSSTSDLMPHAKRMALKDSGTIRTLRTDERPAVLAQMVDSERDYIQELNRLVLVYVTPMLQLEISIVENHIVAMFLSTVEQMTTLHDAFFKDLNELNEAVKKSPSGATAAANMAEIVVRYGGLFALYRQYVRFHDIALAALITSDEEDVQNFLLKAMDSVLMKGQTLSALSKQPLQRLPQYEVFLNRVMDGTHEEDILTRTKIAAALKVVASAISSVTDAAGEKLRLNQIIAVEEKLSKPFDLLAPGRQFLHEGPLTKVLKKGPRPCYVFLFSDSMLICRKEAKKLAPRRFLTLEKAAIYDLAVESGREDTFAVHCYLKQVTFKASSLEEKNIWMTKFKQILSDLERKESPHWAQLKTLTKISETSSDGKTRKTSRAKSLPDVSITCGSCAKEFSPKDIEKCSVCDKYVCKDCIDAPASVYTTMKKKDIKTPRKCKACVLAETKASLKKLEVDDDDDLDVEKETEKDTEREDKETIDKEDKFVEEKVELRPIRPSKQLRSPRSPSREFVQIFAGTEDEKVDEAKLVDILQDISKKKSVSAADLADVQKLLGQLLISESLFLRDLLGLLQTFMRPLMHAIVTYYWIMSPQNSDSTAKSGTKSSKHYSPSRKIAGVPLVVLNSLSSSVSCYINSLEEIYTLNWEFFLELVAVHDKWESSTGSDNLVGLCKLLLKLNPLLKLYSVYSSFDEVREELAEPAVQKLFSEWAVNCGFDFKKVLATPRKLAAPESLSSTLSTKTLITAPNLQNLLMAPVFRIAAYDDFVVKLKKHLTTKGLFEENILAYVKKTEHRIERTKSALKSVEEEKDRVGKLRALELKFENVASLRLLEDTGGFSSALSPSAPSPSAASAKRRIVSSFKAHLILESKAKSLYELTLLTDILLYSECTAKGLKLCGQYLYSQMKVEKVNLENKDDFGIAESEAKSSVIVRTPEQDFALVFSTPSEKDLWFNDVINLSDGLNHPILYVDEWDALAMKSPKVARKTGGEHCRNCKVDFSDRVSRFICLSCANCVCQACSVNPGVEAAKVSKDDMSYRKRSSLRSLAKHGSLGSRLCTVCWIEIKSNLSSKKT